MTEELTPPTWSDAKQFLGALTGTENASVMLQVFDDKGENGRLAEWRYGRLSDPAVQKWLVVKIKAGCGVFVVVNRTDGKGRRRQNITHYLASFIDLDGQPLPATWPIDPDIVVESSSGRYHAYWLLEPDTDLVTWSDCQARLACFYKGDSKVIDPPRVMRLAGFDHQKRRPFRTRVLACRDPSEVRVGEFDRRTLQDIADAHPCDYVASQPPAEPGAAPTDIEWDTEQAIDRARVYLDALEPPEIGERNNCSYIAAAKLHDLAISAEQSLELLSDWNATLDDPLPEHELRDVIASAAKYKQNPAGVDLADEDDMEGQVMHDEEPSDWNAADLGRLEVPPQGWIVRDMVPADEAILNNGDGGTGKTTTMLQLAASVATGKDWLGKTIECGAQRVIFFSCEEDIKKVKLKLAPIIDCEKSPYGLSWSDLGNLKVIGLKDRESTIAKLNPKTGSIVATEVYDYFAKTIQKFEPRLVIIDALYDVYSANENDRAQVRKFVSLVRKFCSIKPPCAVIVLGHPSMTGINTGTGTSGSTGWRNAFRGFLFTTAAKNKAGVTVHRIESRKQNYGKPDSVIDFTWDELFVHVLDDAKDKKADKAEAMFVKLLDAINKDGRGVGLSPNGAYAPRELAKDPRAHHFDKADFEAVMRKLIATGRIKVRPYKTLGRKNAERLEIITAANEFGINAGSEKLVDAGTEQSSADPDFG